jgi:hypothetical protein
VMAEIFSGLASMPRWLMMKPSSLLEGTPKTHLFGLSFQRYSRRDSKVSLRSSMRVLEFLVLTTVGGSPRGPPKQRGNPHLNPATTPKHAKPNHAGD